MEITEQTYPESVAGENHHNRITIDFIRQVYASRERDTLCVAEIGVHKGATSREIAKFLDNKGALHLYDFEHKCAEVATSLKEQGFHNVRHYGNSMKTLDSYNWQLMKRLEESDSLIYDFVYLDGSHTWAIDALSFFLIDLLLKPGGFIDFDDYGWSLAKSPSLNPTIFPETATMYTEEQINQAQVKMIIELIVRRDVRYEEVVKNKIFRKKIDVRNDSSIKQILGKQIDENRANLSFINKAQMQNYQQTESYISLTSCFTFRAPLRPMRGWAVSPDFCLHTIIHIMKKRPSKILELGSGVSTILTGYALEKNGNGRVLTLEHSDEYIHSSQQDLCLHQVDHFARILLAPLKPYYDIEGKTWHWYDLDEFSEEENSIDLLVIDGPPGNTQPLARYPALPLLWKYLTDTATIILDDTNRNDEQNIIQAWIKEFPGLHLSTIEAEKGMVILQRQPTE